MRKDVKLKQQQALAETPAVINAKFASEPFLYEKHSKISGQAPMGLAMHALLK